MEKRQIMINGKPATEKELQMKQDELKAQKGMTLVEVAPSQFKTRIQG